MGSAHDQMGRVIAVEAQERIFYALAGNVALNNCFNVQVIHAAAGASDGVMRIPTPNYTERASFGSLELKPLARPENIGQPIDYREEALTPIRVMRLDSLNLQRLDLIKIDVEGMEIEVLEGAAQALKQHKPVLLVEHQKADAARMSQLLGEAGYLTFDSGGMNLLAIHREDPSLEHIVQDA